MIDSTQYTGLVTPEHNKATNFMAVLALLVSGHVDSQNVALLLPTKFDFDVATGEQLDAVGLWVGLTRFQDVPTIGLVQLNDTDYRVLLRAKILANHWDGGMESLQVILASLFPGTGITLFAVDYQDMSMDIYILGGTPNPLQLALLKGGLLVPKPEGVRINGFILAGGGPLFGFGRDDAFISGFGVGSFPTYL